MATIGNQKLMWDDPKFANTESSIWVLTKYFGRRMLEQAGLTSSYPREEPLSVFDNACGTGVVTMALHEMMEDRPLDSYSVTCGDFTDAMVEAARKNVTAKNWTNTAVSKIDAQNTNLPSNQFTHIFTNFGPMLLPNPSAMLQECHRTLKPHGTCAFTTWQTIGWVPDLKAAMESMPELPPFPAPQAMASAFGPGQWDDPDFIRETMASHGFVDVMIEAVPNTSRAESAADLKAVLAPVIGIVTSKFWTEEERKKFEGPQLNERIQVWFEEKYEGKPVLWHWVALVTTAKKS